MTRSLTQTLSAAASIGLLALGLAACGDNSGEDPTPSDTASTGTSVEPSATASDTAEPSETVSTSANTEPSSEPTDSVTESASASPSTTDASSDDPSADATGAASGRTAEIETAITTVMGSDVQILQADQLREASTSMQGITENVTITPASCSPEDTGIATAFPDDAEMVGGLLTDATDPAAPSSEVLSVITFSDAAQGQSLIEDQRSFAETCSTFTLDMGQGISATSDVSVEEANVDGADEVLAHVSEITVEMEGATLPPSASQSTTTTLYVLSGDTLYQYVQAGPEAGTTGISDGTELIEQLQAELDS